MVTSIAADYLVVGAGASGMAFVDNLIAHADVRVVLLDRRHAPGGHWLDAYPFARLHQASAFYGVASTVLGGGAVQQTGRERGLHARATAAEVAAYYAVVLERMLNTGRVEFHPNCEYLGQREFVSRISGRRFRVSAGARLVNASYLSPDIPARTPPPFEVDDDAARVLPVNQLVEVAEPPQRYVVVGSGKTATDACIWLLDNGVDPDSICWVRPRDPWMFNRAGLQPEPATFFTMAARLVAAAAAADSPEDLFLRMEDAGVMLRIDRRVTPTMAKTPTIAQWEIDLLRSIEHVVRFGRIRRVAAGRIHCTGGELAIPGDVIVVHCAASGAKYPPLVPIWDAGTITLQPVRAGFPCFGAAVIGYVEATRTNDDEKNRVCLPSPLADTPRTWARMQVLGNRASVAFSAVPDIKRWSDSTTLNPGRVPPERAGDPLIAAALDRFKAMVRPGMARMAEFAGLG